MIISYYMLFLGTTKPNHNHASQINMGRYNGKACRLVVMMSMTLTFFVVELVVGHISNSLALIADSFHMLSDVVALIVGFMSVKVSRLKRALSTQSICRALRRLTYYTLVGIGISMH